MNWTEQAIRHLVAELADDNPLACRALFRITDILFTEAVPTLAVSLSAKPVLQINLAFLCQHAQTEAEVKAVLLHEFLHVLLGHTEKFSYNTPLLNIALDAIINAIIHRTCGPQWSGFFARLYPWKGMSKLLRPAPDEFLWSREYWEKIQDRVYAGKVGADDLHELLQHLHTSKEDGSAIPLLVGNHEAQELSEAGSQLLDGIIKQMDGTRIWRKPRQFGHGKDPDQEELMAKEWAAAKWRAATQRLLRRCLIADNKGRKESHPHDVYLPLPTPSDRRAFLRMGWSPVLPFARHRLQVARPQARANVYLDVSGSMHAELEALVGLLHHFHKELRRPLWVFSNDVYPASFRNGKLRYESTGGTSIGCVFDQLRKQPVRKALIVTDGYVESITPEMLVGIDKNQVQVLVSADGDASAFEDNGLPFYKLPLLD
ncbi:Predicted metal-dependent peptidase [Cnuella takakiae]|uniref:Predicted metal-dependent peptidase n=1 Tax=Cnuella takakiae TaxID=1302690 RepID=A0A1M4TEC7_9BACT|nr:hypothetical protein [Cnuella takakiae]OLY90722.1 hypothetical protein BUE76_01520 [Cnuella takakiae]SHE42748.1 Predicted metal-dependent peptidase [Cnuella takakiae]